MKTLECNQREFVRSLFKNSINDVRSATGTNLRRILQDTGVVVVPGKTRPSALNNYKVYEVPVGEEWRLSLLQSLVDIRDEHWEVIFDEEDESTFADGDIAQMIEEVCSN